MRLPWGRAPRAALSSPVTIVVAVVTGLVVAFVAASTVFHVSASGSAAVQYVTERRCPDETGLMVERSVRGFFGTSVTGSLNGQYLRLRDVAERNGLDQVRRTRYGSTVPITVGGERVEGRLITRDGAQQNLRPIAGGGTEGAWVPSEVTERFGVQVGDELVLNTGETELRVPVTAVYPEITEPVDDFWCSQRSEIIKLVAIPEGQIKPPVIVVSPELFDQLAAQGLPVQLDRIQVSSSKPPTNLADAERYAAAIGVVRTVAERGDPEQHGRPRVYGSAITYVNDRAAYPADSGERAQQAVGGSLLPLAGLSLAVGLAAVAGLAGQWLQRRFAELRLLWVRGASPASLGLKAVLELGAPLAVGAAAGWVLARALAPVLAPADEFDDWAPAVAWYAVGGTWLACLLVLAVAATMQVRGRFQGSGRHRLRRVLRWLPWELAVGVLLVLSWQRLSGGALVVSRSELLPRVDVLALMFPLLCLALLAGVGTRLAGLGLRLGHRARGWRWPAVTWAVRRAAAQHRLTVALLAVAGLAVGVVAVGIGVSDTERQAVLDKGRLFVGSDTAVRLLASVPKDTGVPDALRGSSTQIGVRDVTLGSKVGRVLTLDPATAPDAMPWRPAWGGGAELTELLSRLGPPGPDGRVPVITFGSVNFDLVMPDGIDEVEVVGTVETFPGREHADAMMVMSWEGMAGADPRGFTRYVLTTGDGQTAVRELEAAGEPTGWTYTAESSNDALPFLVVAWTFDFFATLGAVLALVAVAALLVTIEARRRATAVAHALLARMGLRARGMYASQVVELAGLAVAAMAVGLFGGWLVLATASGELDPAPWLSPTPVPTGLGLLALLVVGVAVLSVGVVAAIATRAALRAPVRELLRG